MKNLYVFILLISPFFTQGQITLTADDMPKAGDLISSANCEIPVGFSIGSPGANQIYDFSMLTPIDTFSTNFISPDGTAGMNEFPNANLAGEFDGDLVYYTQTNSELLLLGSYIDTSENGIGQYFATHFIPSTKIFEIPSTYNTNWTDMSSWTNTFPDESVGIDSFRTTSTTMDTILFDGYGTVNLPNGSFDALRERRISTFTTEFDTYALGVWTNVFTSIDTDTSYNWYGKNNPNLASVNIFNGEIVNINYSVSGAQISAPVAGFSSNDIGGGTFDFTDNSTNMPTSWMWDFGDGNTSTQQNPQHTFAISNSYNVCLTATNNAGSDMHCQMIVVTNATTTPVADFNSTDLGNGTFDFTDNSTNVPTSWLWNFGDGNTSTEQNPQHTFTTSDTYNVCLTAANAAGSDMHCQMIDVIITATDDHFNSEIVKIYPNPVTQVLHIQWKDQSQKYLNFQLMNASGQSVLDLQKDNDIQYSIDVKNLANGMYFYNLKDSSGLIRKKGSVLKQGF